MLAILLVSGLLAFAINLLHPRRIPWVQDWSIYVESRAREAGIEIVPLSVVYSMFKAGDGLFIDARPATEFEAGHIPGAISLPFEELDSRLETLIRILDVHFPLIAYCSNRECDDALMLAIALQDMGKTNLLYYVDGFDVWKEEGCPVETE